MTFKEHYIEAKKLPRPCAPATTFIREVAEITKKNEATVYRWLNGTEPDALTKEVLAKHFNSTPEKLFPQI